MDSLKRFLKYILWLNASAAHPPEIAGNSGAVAFNQLGKGSWTATAMGRKKILVTVFHKQSRCIYPYRRLS
jgi:hypothetical protein